MRFLDSFSLSAVVCVVLSENLTISLQSCLCLSLCLCSEALRNLTKVCMCRTWKISWGKLERWLSQTHIVPSSTKGETINRCPVSVYNKKRKVSFWLNSVSYLFSGWLSLLLTVTWKMHLTNSLERKLMAEKSSSSKLPRRGVFVESRSLQITPEFMKDVFFFGWWTHFFPVFLLFLFFLKCASNWIHPVVTNQCCFQGTAYAFMKKNSLCWKSNMFEFW